MEIIKRGTLNQDRTWYGKCITCNSEAIATENEIANKIFDQRDSTYFAWEQCPVCGMGGGGNECGGMLFYPKVGREYIYHGR